MDTYALSIDEIITCVATYMTPMTRSIACRVNKKFSSIIVGITLSKKLTTTLYTCCRNHLLHAYKYTYTRSDNYPYAVEVSNSRVRKIISSMSDHDAQYISDSVDKIDPIEYLSDYHLLVREINSGVDKNNTIFDTISSTPLNNWTVDVDIAKKFIDIGKYIGKFVFPLYFAGINYIDIKSFIPNLFENFDIIAGAACGAALSGNIDFIKDIINIVNITYHTKTILSYNNLVSCAALHSAVAGNQIETVTYLLSIVVEDDMSRSIIEAVIPTAAKNGNCEIINMIIKYTKGNISYEVVQRGINAAIIHGYTNAIDILIKLKPVGNWSMEELLIYACKYGTVESVRHLLQMSENFEIMDLTTLAKYPAMHHRGDIVNCIKSHSEINMEMISEVLNSHA